MGLELIREIFKEIIIDFTKFNEYYYTILLLVAKIFRIQKTQRKLQQET